MAKNFIQRGDVLTIPAPATVVSGAPIIAGSIVGVALGDAASGAPVDVAMTGVFRLPKVGTDVLTVGEAVFLDGTGLVTDDADSGARVLFGHAVEAAGNGVATVAVRLAG